MMTKILVISPAYEPFYHLGGPSKSVPKLVKCLRRNRNKVNVVTANHGSKDFKKNFGTIYCNSTFLDSFFHSFLIRTKNPFFNCIFIGLKLLKKSDILILNCGFYFPNTILGIVAMIWRKKILFIPRGASGQNRMKRNFYLKKIICSIDNIFLKKSTLVQLSLNEDISIYKPRRILNVPNIIEGNNESKQSSKKLQICFLGRPVKDKGFEEFLKLSKQFSHIKFIAIISQEHKKNIAGLNNIDIFVNPDQELIKKILSMSHFNFLWSIGEGLSMSLLEGASVGCLPLINPLANDKVFSGNEYVFSDLNQLSNYINKFNYNEWRSKSETLKKSIRNSCSHDAVYKKLKPFIDE